MVRAVARTVVDFLKKEDGPTAVEYAVMLALIIVVCIGAVTAIGSNANAVFTNQVEGRFEELSESMHVVGREARTIEGRLSKENWIVGQQYSAADMMIFPVIQLLRRALARPQAAELGARFLPMERNYPALARWIARIESLPGYDRTYPPHWR